jgi:hypothetical protein
VRSRYGFLVRSALVLTVVVAALTSAQAAPAAPSATCLPGRQAPVLVRYERTGGFAGIREALTVRRSGSATLVRTRGSSPVTFRLACARLRRLRTALVNARFASLAPVYAPDTPVADGFVESVSYGGRTVRVLTGAEPPPRLERVLELLRAIVAKRR